MPKKQTRYSPLKECPCGTNKKYQDCCLKEKRLYYVDQKGNVCEQIKIPPKFAKTLANFQKEQNKKFKEIFGRDLGPSDPLFFDMKYGGPSDEMLRVFEEAAEKANLNPAWVHVFRKTGFFVTEENLHRFTSSERAEIEEAYQEYIKNEEKPDPKLSATIENLKKLSELFNKSIFIISFVADKLLEKEQTKNQVNLVMYAWFCVKRASNHLKSISILMSMPETAEDSLNILRSIYECYLLVLNIRINPDKMIKHHDARMGIRYGEYELCRRKNGELDPNNARNLKTGEIVAINLSKKTLLANTPYPEDRQIHQFIYDFMCSYTHPDVSRISNYLKWDVHGINPYPQSEPLVFSLFFTCLPLNELNCTSFIKNSVKDDISRFVKFAKVEIQTFLRENPCKYEGKDYTIMLADRLEKLRADSSTKLTDFDKKLTN